MTAPTYDIDDCPDLSSFTDLARPGMFGLDPAELRTDLLAAVREGIEAHPRSAQREIGPSQIGHPCNRWLAYFFAEVPPTGLQSPPWRQAVGTAVHTEFSDWLHRWNELHGMRYLTDMRVWIGDLYPGRPITGTFDAFDTWTCTGIDLKVPGPNGMKRYAPGKPEDPQYDVQLDSYGVGAQAAGLHVRNVGTLRLPSAGELSDAVWKVREHNPGRAKTALARAGGIATLVNAIGPAAIEMQPTTEHFCTRCEWFRPGSTDLQTGCPGAESVIAKNNTPPAALTALAGTPTPAADAPQATPNTALAAI